VILLKLKAMLLEFMAGKENIVVLDDEVAGNLGVKPLDRVRLRCNGREMVAIVNIGKRLPRDSIALYDEVAHALNVTHGDIVEVEPATPPDSIRYIKRKIRGERLSYGEILEIVRDIISGRLSDIELTALVTTLHHRKMSIEEAYYFARAMVETGETLNLKKKPILDKHSLGGVPGDKTTILVVPIIASLGYIIPKTSSRAITSPAGTADRVEVLCPVNLSIDEMREVVYKTNGCMVWGGALKMAPADDLIIKVEYPLGIDPFFIPSILAKKASVGSTHIVIDIPMGRGTKVKSLEEASSIANDFIEIGGRLGMHIECAATYGDQPIGYAIGPALEAKEALQAVMTQKPLDLIDKATSLAGILLGMVGESDGKAKALEALRKGKVEKKLREIIEAQGGDPKIMPEDIPIGDKMLNITAEKEGYILWIDNRAIASLARAAGAPKDKGAGILLNVKLGDYVKKGDILFRIYAEKSYKLEFVEKVLEEMMPMNIGKPQKNMLIKRFTSIDFIEKWIGPER